MHTTYRVDENKDLIQNQSGTNGSGADESASLSVSTIAGR